MMLNTYLIISNLLVLKNQQNDPSTEKQINEYSEKLNSIRDIMENRTMRNKLDMKVIKTETNEN